VTAEEPGGVDVQTRPDDVPFVFVPHLPDLISPQEYDAHPDGHLVRIEISVTDDGVRILGDAFRPAVVERLLAALGEGPIQEMLCG
jgi:hypothetical protein